MKYTFFWIFISGIFLQSYGQEYVTNWYNDDSGLPQNSVKNIAKDDDGFIWFATESGLVRYNGQNFKTYSKIEGLDNQRMEYFFRDKDTLFVRTSKNEILYIKNLNPHLYSSYQDEKRTNFDEISDISFIEKKYKSNQETNLVYHQFEERDEKIASTKTDFFLLDKNEEVIKSFKTDTFKDFRASYISDNNWYIVTKKEVLKFDFENLDFNKVYAPDSLDVQKTYYNQAHEQVFIVDQNKIYKVHNEQDNFYLLQLHNKIDIKDKFITCMFYDEEYPSLYTGSWALGLGISKRNKFTTIQVKKDRYKNLVYAFYPTTSDTIYTPTGVVIHDKEIIQENSIEHRDLIKQFFPRDQDGYFYAANGRDIFKLKLDSKSLSFSEKKFIKFKNDIGALYITDKNELYFSSKTFGNNSNTYLFKTQDLNKKQTNLDTVLKFNHQILFIKESLEKDNLWLGTDNGVYVYDKSTQDVSQIKGTQNTRVRSINEKENYVWFASYDNGFSHYNKQNDQLTQFPFDQQSRLRTVHHVIEDDFNQVWMPTNKGLFKANKEQLFEYANNKTGQVNYYVFDRKDGLVTNEFNGGCYPCNYKDKYGNVYLPSLNGLVTFNPKAFSNYYKENEKVYLDEIIIDGKSYPPTENFSIPRNFKTLEVRVDALSFNKLPFINFTSPLAPNLSEYSSVTEGKLIFTTLPYGIHQLNFSLGSNEKDIQTILTLEVERDWYETNWFRFIVFLFVALFVFVNIKLILIREEKRSNQLKRIINEKTKQLQSTIQDLRSSQDHFKTQLESQKKIVASISHDIKSPLQYLAYGIQFLDENLKKKNLDNEVYENIDAPSSSVDKLQEFTQNILDFSKAMIQSDAKSTEKINVRTLVEEKAGLFEQMCKAKKINLEIISKQEVNFVINKNLFAVILHNILDNAIKNTYNGFVKIKLQKIGKQLLLKITDSGAGMNQETLERYRKIFDEKNQILNVSGSGLGLYIVSETARLMEAEIEIESKKGFGTSFFMKLK
ncbi:sensor histidine kinase [Psychroflexus planctonicus]|uniref:histidine kinase n=1 Tax=Psychroflexus planctonicus TaxID=1526575 RepID=A0ABQ1SG24_9FLAO|nr:HAMP domain-containing sensor histidine kinase [Psychroflexus planctonicus]GGE29808.1 hypothetical protein GCM10010832_07910 [Psychroflexus planctonicus]